MDGSFVWGDGGQIETTSTRARRRLAEALMQEGSSGTPIASWTQGLNRVAQALVGGYRLKQEDQRDQALEQNTNDLLASYPGFAGQTSSVSTPMGRTSIPAGSIDPRLSEAISGATAANPGVDPAYMTRLALVENGGKVEGGSPLSSAQGPFQFLSGTARQYGLSNPNDPNASANAAARFTLDNKAALTNALGREPTPGELYLAHQQGVGGAIGLLQHPDAPVESVIGAAAAHNNAATPGMTAGQFAQRWTGKFGDIVQQVDPTQKNIIDAQADDPAAIPVNAQPTQGFAIPGQAAPQMPPAVANWVQRAIRNPATRSTALQLWSQYAKPRETHSQVTDGAGNMWDVNDQTGQRTVALKHDKPEALPTSVQEYQYYRSTLPPGQEAMPYDTWATAKARAAATTVNNDLGGGTDKQVFDAFDERSKAARATAQGLTGIRNAREAIEGGAITGFSADNRLLLQKAASYFGVPMGEAGKIQNSEVFKAAIAPQIAAVLKATVGNANISDSDRRFAERAAGGSLDLDEGSIKKLLNIMERASVSHLQQYQEALDSVYPDPEKHKRERALFGVRVTPGGKAAGTTSTGRTWSIE